MLKNSFLLDHQEHIKKTKWFIDDLCTINDEYIHPMNWNWKWSINEYMSLFLTLISLSKIMSLLLSSFKKEINLIVKKPHLSSNIPSFIFYDLFSSGWLSIFICTLPFTDFTPKASQLFNQVVLQRRNAKQLQNRLKKCSENIQLIN